MSGVRRLGVFGGAFNPVHLAHLRLAEEARDYCALDCVLFLPTAQPPHKRLTADAPSFVDRYAMVTAAVADNPAFAVSDLEAQRPGKSYSVQTLEILRERYPACELYFLIGMDSFRDLSSWWEYRRLFALANLVVTRRPGVDGGELYDLLPVAARTEFCYDSSQKGLLHCSGRRIIPLDETYLDISSTRIRSLTAAGHSIRYLVPAAVADYIEEHGLYRGPERL